MLSSLLLFISLTSEKVKLLGAQKQQETLEHQLQPQQAIEKKRKPAVKVVSKRSVERKAQDAGKSSGIQRETRASKTLKSAGLQ